MKTDIMEATRLMRQGRLAEAMALMQRTLKGGDTPPQVAVGQSSPLEPSTPTGQVATEPAEPRTRPASGTIRRVPTSRSLVSPQMLPVDLGGPGLAGLLGRGAVRQPTQVDVPGHWLTGTHTGAAGRRDYKLYIPSGYDGQAMPLVVMLHGCTQNPDDFAAGTGMNGVAEAEGFLVVYPAQASTANPSKCWNWFKAAHQQREQGEPALIAGITRQVMAQYHIDPSRVYVAGLSAGGAMAAIMGATYPDLYAAVGVHSGLAPACAQDLPSAMQAMHQGGPRGPAGVGRRAPLILFHGDVDATVHTGNADCLVQQWTAAGCQTPGTAVAPVTVERGQVDGGHTYTRQIYRDGHGQPVVERWTIHGAGHAWSGGNHSGSYTDPAGPDASRELARFFREHPQAAPTVHCRSG
jgi:poly(hydroxyalkanoate) depolymerase family esterase